MQLPSVRGAEYERVAVNATLSSFKPIRYWAIRESANQPISLGQVEAALRAAEIPTWLRSSPRWDGLCPGPVEGLQSMADVLTWPLSGHGRGIRSGYIGKWGMLCRYEPLVM